MTTSQRPQPQDQYLAMLRGETTSKPERTAADEPEEDRAEREPVKKIPAWKIFAGFIAFVGVIMLISWIAEPSGDEDPSWRVGTGSFSTSPGGRVEVTFSVTNTGERIAAPECDIRAMDADGMLLGGDRTAGLTPVMAGDTERYRVLTGIDAAGVARVTIICD